MNRAMPGDNSCTVQCELLLPEPARYRTCFRKMEIFRQAMPGDNSYIVRWRLMRGLFVSPLIRLATLGTFPQGKALSHCGNLYKNTPSRMCWE